MHSNAHKNIKYKATLLLGLAIVIAGAYFGYVSLYFMHKRAIGDNIVKHTSLYEKVVSGQKSILILGDSLAYGVGADSPEASFAGVLAKNLPDYSVINKAVVGYDTQDLSQNIDRLATQDYEAIYIIIGGNDIIRFKTDLSSTAQNLSQIYLKASKKAKKVYLITSYDFKHVGIVPIGLHGWFSDRSKTVRDSALEASKEFSNTQYIDMFYESYGDFSHIQAADGFHLNDIGVEALVKLILRKL
jgi:lysophospholipase L1-like esterase